MKMKILRILAITLSSITFLISCSNTEIIWTDLRANPKEDEIKISFFNSRKKKIKEISLICGKTKFTNVSIDYLPNGFSRPENMGFNYLVDFENKKMEIFLMDYDSFEISNYNSCIEKKENVYAYNIMFLDKIENKLCTIISKDNNFSIEKKNILANSVIVNQSKILELISQSDIAYFFEADNLDLIEKQKRYLVKGKVLNHFFWISPNTTGPVDCYIKDESLPDWLKKKL